jgi:hypothetical protein
MMPKTERKRRRKNGKKDSSSIYCQFVQEMRFDYSVHMLMRIWEKEYVGIVVRTLLEQEE